MDRTFRDINGIEWQVTHVAPASPVSSADTGWLSFQAGWLERHLSPFPSNWQTATVQRLEQMCRIATPVQLLKSAIASNSGQGSNEPLTAAPVDTTPAVGTDVVLDDAGVTKHMSLLANSWPASDPRVTFRG